MGFSLGSSSSIFLLLHEGAPWEFQLSSQATAVSLITGCGGWALHSSALGKREGGQGGREGGGLRRGVA